MISTFIRRLINISILLSIVSIISSIYVHSDSSFQLTPYQPTQICKPFITEWKNLNVLSIVEKCHHQYTNLEIIKKCQQFFEADFIDDHALFALITSKKKNITYWNIYCGICNFEVELHQFEYWIPWLSCKKQVNESFFDDFFSYLSYLSDPSADKFEDPIDESEMLKGLKIGDDKEIKLISVLNVSTYDCHILRVCPSRLRSHVRECSEFSSEHTNGIEFRKSIVNHFNPRNDSDQFCSAATESEIESLCGYRNQYGESCSKNLFLNQSDGSVCTSDGYFWIPSSKSSEDGTWNECSNHTTKKNTIYVCGPTRAQIYKKIKNFIFKIMDYVSAFLLFLYLVMSTNKQNLRSLPKRIFYSYSISLWALYLCDFILKYVRLCLIKYYVFFYIWQSHSFWILITSFDLWRIVYNSLKLKRIRVEGKTLRFLGYCFLGWGLPAVFLAGLFPTLNDVQKSWSCPSVSGFSNELTCFSKCELNKYTYTLGWISIAIFLLIAPCLLILTCVYIWLSKRNRARSSVDRTYTFIMMKVAIMMGLHWMLLVYLTLFDSGEKFSIVYEFISSFQGSFIFFAFGLEKDTWEMFRKKFMFRSATEEQTQRTSLTENNREVGLLIRSDKPSADDGKQGGKIPMEIPVKCTE